MNITVECNSCKNLRETQHFFFPLAGVPLYPEILLCTYHISIIVSVIKGPRTTRG